MAYYDNNSWSGSPAGRQGPWDPAAPPSRPGTTQVGPAEDSTSPAFYYQIASVDRAVETWRKSSKAPVGKTPSRNAARYRPEHGIQGIGADGPQDPRMGLGPRFPPPAEFDPMRPAGGHVQGYLAGQRFGGRPTEADPAQQAKRRMAAQRERELRNYHQEQQFQKHLSAAKSDRSMSPNTGMSEDERRDLIARQHRALYGAESSLYSPDQPTPRAISQDARVTSGVSGGFRRASPYDAFGIQSGGPGNDSAVVMPQREGKDFPPNTSSPASNANNNPLNLSENAQQQSSRTSNSSPGGSPPHDRNKSSATSGNVAPIGTRPPGGQQQGGSQPSNLQKRSTTPLTSPLGYGFSADQGQAEKTSSGSDEKAPGNIRGGWGNSSGVWGGKGGLGVQAKVWG